MKLHVHAQFFLKIITYMLVNRKNISKLVKHYFWAVLVCCRNPFYLGKKGVAVACKVIGTDRSEHVQTEYTVCLQLFLS